MGLAMVKVRGWVRVRVMGWVRVMATGWVTGSAPSRQVAVVGQQAALDVGAYTAGTRWQAQ